MAFFGNDETRGTHGDNRGADSIIILLRIRNGETILTNSLGCHFDTRGGVSTGVNEISLLGITRRNCTESSATT